MQALNGLVLFGKVRYFGCSSCCAWGFQKANNIAEKNGWTKFVSMQNLYNLIYRKEYREVYPHCALSILCCIHTVLIALLLLSLGLPLAGGLLEGKKRNTSRSQNDALFGKDSTNNEKVIDRVLEIAEKIDHSAA